MLGGAPCSGNSTNHNQLSLTPFLDLVAFTKEVEWAGPLWKRGISRDGPGQLLRWFLSVTSPQPVEAVWAAISQP